MRGRLGTLPHQSGGWSQGNARVDHPAHALRSDRARSAPRESSAAQQLVLQFPKPNAQIKIGAMHQAELPELIAPSVQPPPAAAPTCLCGVSATWKDDRWTCAAHDGQCCAYEAAPPDDELYIDEPPMCGCGLRTVWREGQWWCMRGPKSRGGCEFIQRATLLQERMTQVSQKGTRLERRNYARERARPARPGSYWRTKSTSIVQMTPAPRPVLACGIERLADVCEYGGPGFGQLPEARELRWHIRL